MAWNIVYSPSISSSGVFTFNSGWTYGSGSFTSGGSFAINRGAADLGTGPTIVVYGNFYNGSVGSAVPTSQQIGAFTQMTDTNTGSSPPTYETGPDGQSWMNMLTPALTSVGDGSWRQANIIRGTSFDQFYSSYHLYTDGPTYGTSMGSLNEKSLWVCRDEDVGSGGNDMFFSASRQTGSNSGGGGISWGGGNSDNAYSTPPGFPVDDGYTFGGYDTFRSIAVKPHTTASTGALVDAFMQFSNSVQGRYQDTSTGLTQQWMSGGSATWNTVYLLGYYQNRTASPPKATFYLLKDVYFAIGANAWKRFFITDAATLAGSTQIWDCPHTSWAVGAVTIYIPNGITTAGKYLWYGNGTTYTQVGQG